MPDQPEQPPPTATEATSRRTVLRAGAGVLGLAVIGAAAYDAASSGGGSGARTNLTLVAPASAGGGWDSAAREAQQALRANAIVTNSTVLNIPGAGGTIGLSEVVNSLRGDATNLMVMGMVMLGAIEVNGSGVTMEEVTPIARLTDDYDVVVVPADSPLQSMDDLVAEWTQDPSGFTWGGGSLGSVDQMIIAQLALGEEIDPPDVSYLAYSGGGELATSLLSGTIRASVSGYQDFKDQVDAGRLRALAVCAPEPVDIIDLPTLRDEGYDVSITNWRGVVAPPGITDEERAELEAIVTEWVQTPEWQDAITRNQWTDTFLVGAEFETYLQEQTEYVAGIWEEFGY